MTDPTRHGKSNPEVERLLDIVLKRSGTPADGPLTGRYMELIRDPRGDLAKEIFASMPPEEQKSLMDEIDDLRNGIHWDCLHPNE